MDVSENMDAALSRIATAIGEPARTKMLTALLDGRARTSTELAILANVSASTASVHLARLKEEHLVRLAAQGRHRYYSLANENVARALEGLSVLAGTTNSHFTPTTPEPLRYARTCYDHMAGAVSVAIHSHFVDKKWLLHDDNAGRSSYFLSKEGERQLQSAGVDTEAARQMRRKFAYACLDWSERKGHLGGALASVFLSCAVHKRWVTREPDSRVLHLTKLGIGQLQNALGLNIESVERGESLRTKYRPI